MSTITQDDLWKDLKTLDADAVRAKYGDVMKALSHGLRGTITASPGKMLYVADYAGIEARVLLWLAGDDEHLQMFRDGTDIYCDMASAIYRTVVTKEDKDKRALGKVTILGAGFGMGASKFKDTAAAWGIIIDDELSETTINAYREKYWRVKQSWSDQNNAAIDAVNDRLGREYTCGRVSWYREGIFLKVRLPSGRCLCYPYPEVREYAVPWGGTRPTMTFMGVDTYSRQWCRQKSYGGLLVQNATQAVARDLMAHGMTLCEAAGYEMVLTVHDEGIGERHPALGSIAEFEKLMATPPLWGTGIPLAVEGWAGERYHK